MTAYALGGDQDLSSFDMRVGALTDRISRLEEMGANVTGLVERVNDAVRLASTGRVDEANRMLDGVEANITRLEPIVEHEYRIRLVEKYSLAGFLLALPLLVYWGLPRLYLALWYRSRRRWLVEEQG